GRLGEERQVRVALLLLRGVVADVDLAADDRLYALLLRLLVVLNRARERAVVGEPDRRHLQLCGAGGKSRNPTRTIEDRVLGVDVQMDEACLGHGEASLRIRSAGTTGPAKRNSSNVRGARPPKSGRAA